MKKVTLEPELEAIAGSLGIFDRLMMAQKMARWVHQLRISALILAQPPVKPRKRVRLRGSCAKWN
jgi:hypothetical protein